VRIYLCVMESLKDVLSSFDLKKELNPNIWVNGGEKINPKVRRNLLEISNQFIDSFGLEIVIDDIIVTGSIANYNWSKYSDIDLHLLIDYRQFPEEMKDLYIEFFDLKKIVFNQKRDVKMFGFDVEVYVEDVNAGGVSAGVYSVMRDEWISKPKKESMGKPNMKQVKEKSEQWMRIINGVLDNIEEETPEEIKSLIKKYKNKLKKFRICGLEKGGEMSVENLVFKVLRRNGYIEKLYNVPVKVIDKKLSLDEKLRNK